MIKRTTAAVLSIVVIGAVFVGLEWIFVPSFGGCVSTRALSAYVECSAAFLDHHGAGITALATIVIAAFTGTLWFATVQSTELARESFSADKRAFVFAMGINGFWERNTSGQYNWRFRPLWQNSGDTPSKNLRIFTGCELRNTQLPVGFDFNQSVKEGSGLLPPKSTLSGGLAPAAPQAAITPQDILDVQAGRKFLYLWGWAKYHDVFPGTKEHVTHFCWLVTPVGDPLKYIPGTQSPAPGGLAFHTIHHPEGNCADEECG